MSSDATTIRVVIDPELLTVDSTTVVATGTTGPRGPAGPEGPQGEPGPAGGTLTKTAGQNLSGHRVVVVDDDGRVVYADPTNLDHRHRSLLLGTQAVVQDDDVLCVALGEVTESSWSWTPGAALYVAANGQLTETEPAAGSWLVLVAQALTATSIFFRPLQPFQR